MSASREAGTDTIWRQRAARADASSFTVLRGSFPKAPPRPSGGASPPGGDTRRPEKNPVQLRLWALRGQNPNTDPKSTLSNGAVLLIGARGTLGPTATARLLAYRFPWARVHRWDSLASSTLSDRRYYRRIEQLNPASCFLDLGFGLPVVLLEVSSDVAGTRPKSMEHVR